MKQKFLDAFMDTAHRFAQLSTARRSKVGAIIVKDGRIISIGYNGTPAGWDNNCEHELIEEDPKAPVRLQTKEEVLHAERNAIDKLARGHESGDGAVMFVTHAPCLECAKSIYGSGIVEVFYKTEYRLTAGIDFLRKCGVEVTKINN